MAGERLLRYQFLLDQIARHPRRLVFQPSIQPRQAPLADTGHSLDNLNDKTKLIHGDAAHGYDLARHRGLLGKTGRDEQRYYERKWLPSPAIEA